ncbi:MAG: class I SAM-dependent methyltransferase [Candidatus Humimicrobiia bacterium]
MEDKKQISSKEASEIYFEMQAAFGFTKHTGGLKATNELIELCHINQGKYVLDVGCGVGRTACYIAKKTRSRVVGVDISEGMINRSSERAKREGVENRVEFKVADAQDLPFENALFDAVIGESITAFPEDKQRAVGEYVRVTKPGGYVGLNETTWIKTPPPDLAEYFTHISGAKPETPDGWKQLLEGSGLQDLVARAYKISALNQWVNEIRGLDFRDYLGAWYRFLSLLIKSPACRRFAREALSMPRNIFSLFKYLGHGIYVGRR